MKEYDIDKIMQEYDAFVEIVRQISVSAEEQIQKLKGTVVTDEIATDFSEIGVPYARNLLVYGWITQEQFKLAFFCARVHGISKVFYFFCLVNGSLMFPDALGVVS